MRHRKEPTPEQREAARVRREKFRVIVRQVAAMEPEKRQDLAMRCPVVTCEGHGLSVHNQCLLATQKPDATIVGGFRQWLRQGRVVRKGEHGLMIWVPAVNGQSNSSADIPQPADLDRTDREEPHEIRFLMGTVFDISQTVEKGAEQ